MDEPRRYRIQIERSVAKVLRRLPRDIACRVGAAIDELAEDARPHGCKKIKGKRDHYRIRVGDWRITYTIQDDQLVIVVVEVAPRGGAYRNL